jgi:hypothetical protein
MYEKETQINSNKNNPEIFLYNLGFFLFFSDKKTSSQYLKTSKFIKNL